MQKSVKSKTLTDLYKYFKRKLRLVIIINKTNDILFPAEKLIRINNIKDISEIELAYLRADLIIMAGLSDKPDYKFIVDIFKKYSHDAGSVYFSLENQQLERLLCTEGFQKTPLPKLYTKKNGYTPRIYDIDYLKRWGDTDFLKNWKLAGEQILVHMPKGLTKDTVKILDVGCLNGYIMETLRLHSVKNIFGNDISYEVAVKYCINKYHLPAITIGDFCENNYPDKFSDLTVAMEILEHIPPDKTDKFISELKRVTDDNGRILISTSEDVNIDPTHINCRKRSEWYYAFAKYGLIPSIKQTIFPGFNNFVFHKTTNRWKESMWRNIIGLFYILKKHTKITVS